jgi:hypothetical protein
MMGRGIEPVIDPAIAAHVRETLASRGVTSPRCPLCGAEGWDAWDMQLSGVTANAPDVGAMHQQKRVDLICQTCACVLSLRASALGLSS